MSLRQANPLTVVEVVQHLQPGGLEHLALDLAKFAQKDRTTYVVSLEGNVSDCGEEWGRLSELGDRLIYMNKGPGLQPGLVQDLAHLFRKLRADAVHTHHLGPLLYGGVAARLAGVRRRVHTEHNAWHFKSGKNRLLQGIALLLARPTLVADANEVADALLRTYPMVSPEVILNGIDTERFKPGDTNRARQQLGLPIEEPLVGCAARLEEVKGHDVLLNAIALLPDNIHLALAGDGSLREQLKLQAAALGISSRVHFLGCLDDMQKFYQAIDLFCLPSRNEGLPLAPLEAQSCGVPCVVTDVGACREAVVPNAGLVVEPGECGALAQAIKRGLSNMAIKPRDFILRKFDVRTMVRSYEQLYT